MLVYRVNKHISMIEYDRFLLRLLSTHPLAEEPRFCLKTKGQTREIAIDHVMTTEANYK